MAHGSTSHDVIFACEYAHGVRPQKGPQPCIEDHRMEPGADRRKCDTVTCVRSDWRLTRSVSRLRSGHKPDRHDRASCLSANDSTLRIKQSFVPLMQFKQDFTLNSPLTNRAGAESMH